MTLLHSSYLAAFGAAALACLAGAWHARRLSDPDTRRGLQALLLTSAGWAGAYVGYLWAPTPRAQAGFYMVGFVLGFAAVWAWLWFCSAYTSRSTHRTPAARWFAVLMFAAVALTKLTNPWHGLYFAAAPASVPFPHLQIDHHQLYWLSLGLSYALAAVGYFMLFELLAEVRSATGILGALFGLTALPGVLNGVGYASPRLLNVSHEPLGVAVFALGVLFVYARRFEGVRWSGQNDDPALVLGADGTLRNYNESAAALFPELTRREAIGVPLTDILPSLAEALDQDGNVSQLGEADPPRYYQLTASRFGAGPRRSDQLLVLSDVTAQEESRRRLARDRRLLAEALEQADESVLITDAEPLSEPGPRIVYANSAFEEMTGYDRKEIVGKTPRILQGPDTDRKTLASLRAALEAGQCWSGEAVNYRKDGSTYAVEWNVAPVLDGDGTISHWVSVQRDVTKERAERITLKRQRKSAREALQKHEARLRGLANSVPGGIWQFEVLPDGTYTFGFVSNSIEDLLGIPAAPDSFFERFVERVPEPYREALLASIEEAVEQNEAWSMEMPFEKPGGERIWVQGRSTLERWETSEGEKLVYHGVTIDITDRKEAERALERQNDLFARAQEIASVGAWECDPQAEEVRWTEEVYRIHDLPTDHEVTPEEAIGFYHPEDQSTIESLFGRAVGKAEPYDTELRIITAEGDQRWVRVSGDPETKDGETTCVRGAFQEITDRRKREQALRAAKEEAERMSRLKSAFLANMSHEIRTPLTSIIGFAEAIGEEAEGLREALREADLHEADVDGIDLAPLTHFSRLIEQSGRRLLDTLNGVLNLSKLEAGEMNLSPEPINLSAAAHEATEQFGPKTEEAEVDLQVETNGAPVWARTDEGGLQIAMSNLISNAIKYTGAGGEVWVRVDEREEANGQTAVLEVEDTGEGMDPAQVDRLFEAFKQASEGMGRKYEGSGLGLAVTKQAVEQMDGTIEVATEKGVGTRFTVRLPKANEPSPKA